MGKINFQYSNMRERLFGDCNLNFIAKNSFFINKFFFNEIMSFLLPW